MEAVSGKQNPPESEYRHVHKEVANPRCDKGFATFIEPGPVGAADRYRKREDLRPGGGPACVDAHQNDLVRNESEARYDRRCHLRRPPPETAIA